MMRDPLAARSAGARPDDFTRPDARALFRIVGEAIDEAGVEANADRIVALVREKNPEAADYLEWILEAGAEETDPLEGLSEAQQLRVGAELVASLRILNARRDIELGRRALKDNESPEVIATVANRLAWLGPAQRAYPRAALWAAASLKREGIGEPPARMPIDKLRRRRAERIEARL